MQHPQNTTGYTRPQHPPQDVKFYVCIDMGLCCGVPCVSEIGPFPSMQDAAAVAHALDDEFPGSLKYFGLAGIDSDVPLDIQHARARLKIARVRQDQLEGAV